MILYIHPSFYNNKNLKTYIFKKTLLNNLIDIRNKYNINKSIIIFYLSFYLNDLYNIDFSEKNKNKYSFINTFLLLNNDFTKYLYEKNNNLYNTLKNIIIDFQKYYIIFLYFKEKIYERKKYLIYDCEYDIKMNDFCDINNKYIIHIKENNTIYKFNIQNIRFIIKSNLYANEYLISKPTLPKNPYTNKPFSYTNMYKLYVKMRETNIPIPQYLNIYYKNNLDIYIFKQINYYELEKNAIYNFVYYTCDIELLDYFLDMMYCCYNNKLTNLIISDPDEDYLNEIEKNTLKKIINNSKKIIYNYLLFSRLSNNYMKKLHYNKFCKLFKNYIKENYCLIKKVFLTNELVNDINKNNFTIGLNLRNNN